MAASIPAQNMALDKSHDNFVEEKDVGGIDPTRFLSESHKSYLIARHGTIDLDPTPSMDPADPYNWPSWKVRKNLSRTNILGISLEGGRKKNRSFPDNPRESR